MKTHFARRLVWLVLLLSVTAGAQEYYTWKDDRGRVVMSDRPPQDPAVNFEHVLTPFGRRRDAPTNAAFGSPRGESPGRTNAEPPVRTAQADLKEPDVAECAAAKDRLYKLKTFPRLRTQDADGVRFMTEAEIKEQIENNEALVKRHCID